MFISSISNRKLHCCLIVLILFILIFLSLPLFLIYLANTRYEEWQNQRVTSSNNNNNTRAESPQVSANQAQQAHSTELAQQNSIIAASQPVNCTQFVLDSNPMALANDSIQNGLDNCK